MARGTIKGKSPILVVGAGFAGAVIANVLAESGRYRVTVVDRRPHIGGNAFDCVCSDTGVHFHPYGPHVFHTNSVKVVNYLSRFTEWTPYRHRVRAYVEGVGAVPLPINRDTLNLLYGLRLSNPEDMRRFLDRLRCPVEKPRNALEYLYGIYGRELTNLFFASYTEKMWGMALEELPVSVVARLLIKYDDNPYYFNDNFQMMPKAGYTVLFENLLAHPDVEVQLETRFDKSMEAFYQHCFNSMSIDEYYDYVYGELPYRSIEFENSDWIPSCGFDVPTVNLTDRGSYTRITSWSLYPGPGCGKGEKITIERPMAYEQGFGERYYPVRTVSASPQKAYRRYRDLSKSNHGTTFIGRCGHYIYYDMHQVVAESLKIAGDFLVRDCHSSSPALATP